MTSITIAFISIAVVGVILVLIYSALTNHIRHLQQRLRHQEFQSSLFAGIIRIANKKGVAPDQLKITDKED